VDDGQTKPNRYGSSPAKGQPSSKRLKEYQG